ncbi:sulfite exporter TauE/SafE family protein [Sedimenticola sp.]|uniref:sulfite exporter TauE/SafE family protein n=1 Tax=Sedimenticola sp. TaxID=1940285 RepID=UPI003D0B124C
MDLSLPLAFTVGLFSTLHCIGMCGGIIGALSYGLPSTLRQNSMKFMLFLLAYNSGRILSYAAAGALIGLLGSALLEALGPGQGHRWLQWFAALIMVLIGLHIAGWLPRLAQVERIGAPLWRWLEPLGRRLMPVESIPLAVVYGAIWGWLPCGLVYTMLISTATKVGPVNGALYMAAFGLGTLPSVMATGLLAGRLYRYAQNPYLKVGVGLIIILVGLLTLWYPALLDVTAYQQAPLGSE